jgi:hypothetical protein
LPVGVPPIDETVADRSTAAPAWALAGTCIDVVVEFALTVTVTVEELLGARSAVPMNFAVMECEPIDSSDVLRIAIAPSSTREDPIVVLSS